MLTIVRELARYNIEFAIGVLLMTLVVGFAAMSFFSPVAPIDIYLAPPDVPPSAEYWFGTNSRGQDLFWQLSFALRNTLLFGISVAILSRIISLTVGLIAGYFGGPVDRAIMFVNDTFVSIPLFPILILFYFVLRDSMTWVVLALIMALLGWAYDARLIRSIAMSLRTREFTRHSVFAGMSMPKILLQEHLPYVMPIVFSTTMANMIWSIGMEVTLSVLGFTNIDTPTIGGMLYWANQHNALVAGVWWWLTIPVILIVITFVGLFLLAVSMNEYIDPRSRLRRMGGS